MKFKITMIILLFMGLKTIAQTKYEKGYIINNNGEKIEGLILNEDWSNNPTFIKFKKNNNVEKSILRINSIKEFVVNDSRYIRFNVNIDRSNNIINNSSNIINKMSNKRTPEFKNETLLLKVLVEGSKANLYSYNNNNNLRRFFFSSPDKVIEQFIYKLYKTKNNSVSKNELYKKQLSDFFPCDKNDKNASYTKKYLTEYFINYNNCSGTDKTLINYADKETKGKLVLKLKAGINYNKVNITPYISAFGSVTSKSGFKVTPRFGVELEYLLPLNKNRWSIYAEPSYFNFSEISQGKQVGVFASPDYAVEYKTIEIPIGVRYYFNSKNGSNIFINGGVNIDVPISSTIDDLPINRTANDFEISSSVNIHLGLGYRLANKYSFEIRYNTNKELLTNFIYINSTYSALTLNFGYVLF